MTSSRQPRIARRALLAGLGATSAGLFIPGCRAAEAVRVAVAYDDAGRPIAPDFVGLSYESSIVAPGDYFTPENRSLIGLVKSLGRRGVIRVGGNMSERTVWNPPGAPADDRSVVLTPAAIDRLAASLRVLGWRLIWGLNLARGTPTEAAEEAAYLARAVGPDLLAFQIANEPDGFGLWTHVRPPGYDAAAFLAEWRQVHRAILTRVPHARFAGPAVSFRTDWVARLADEAPDGLVLLTHHYYADGPAGAPHISIERSLQHTARAIAILSTLEQYSRRYRLPYRIAEANSVYNEGQPGVSDTLAAALWAAELMFEIAAAGGSGVNFHGGVHNARPGADKPYTPIARAGSGRYRAAPLYYGMRMFSQTASGELLPTRVGGGSAAFRVFATRDAQGVLRLCLINRQSRRGLRASIDPGRVFTAGTVLRLAGPAPDARRDITLGGAPIDEFGDWAPATAEAPRVIGRDIVVDVPPASAAAICLS